MKHGYSVPNVKKNLGGKAAIDGGLTLNMVHMIGGVMMFKKDILAH